MKQFLYLFFLFAILVTVFSCEEDVPPNDGTNVEFLAFYNPISEKVMGEKKLIAKLSVKNGEITYSKFSDGYPERSIVSDGDVRNNVFALGLYYKDFENRGMYQTLNEDSYHVLPMVQPDEDSDYSYFQTSTPSVSENGYIIYSSATNDKYYGDEYKPFLLRYNTSNNSYDIAESPDNFILSQPEKGNDTEAGQFSRTIFASTNGKYAYGHLEAFGVSGNIHWDYNILYSYNFDTKEYTRLGDSDDSNVTISGMTYDRKKILYSNNYRLKMYNLETGETTFVSEDINLVNVKENSWGNRGACVGTSSKQLYNKDFINDEEYLVCEVPGYGWIYNTMFSKDGQKIYFTIDDGEKKFLCVTDGVETNSTYDTLGTYPIEFYDIIMIK